jgi:hypothetical protein
MSRTLPFLRSLLEARLADEARAWAFDAGAEIHRGVDAGRFCALIALASRHARDEALAPSDEERREAGELLEGWDPERWSVLETLRVSLVLSQPDLVQHEAERNVLEAFRFADVGEQCALYRLLAHLPLAERFTWRAGEGARSNMRVVFEAACCDTPFPFRYFDDVAWRSAVIKAIFVEAPLWRVFGLDRRLSPELARMALDLADERRSAGRPVNPELWLCLGSHAGPRGLAALERELEQGSPRGRAAAALALARAGERDRLRSLVALERESLVRDTMVAALEGKCDQRAFRALDSRSGAA